MIGAMAEVPDRGTGTIVEPRPAAGVSFRYGQLRRDRSRGRRDGVGRRVRAGPPRPAGPRPGTVRPRPFAGAVPTATPGSSAQAYYEHPAYVPLVRRAFDRWYELEQLTGRHLLTECACLNVGPPGGEYVEGVRASAGEHGLAGRRLTPARHPAPFPAFRFPGDDVAGVSKHAAPASCTWRSASGHTLDAAVSLGAEIHADEPVGRGRRSATGSRCGPGTGPTARPGWSSPPGPGRRELLADIGVPLDGDAADAAAGSTPADAEVLPPRPVPDLHRRRARGRRSTGSRRSTRPG